MRAFHERRGGGVGHPGPSRNGLFALAAAALMLAVVLVPLVPDSETEASVSETHTVVYHSYTTAPSPNVTYNSTISPSDVNVTYTGSFVTTEYNPQVWNLGTDGKESENPVRWYQITNSGYSSGGKDNTLVFTGWVYATGFDDSGKPTGYTESRYPGEVMSEAEMDNATYNGKIHVYATWGKMVNYASRLSDVGGVGGSSWKQGNEYTNIVRISGNQTLSDIEHLLNMPTGVTVRGTGNASLSVHETSWWQLTETVLSYNLIIDNLVIRGEHNPKHGDNEGGIAANGHVLVIGTNVSSTGTSLSGDYTQIYGGSTSGNLGGSPTVSRVPFGSDTAVNFKTFVIIHSGTFANVVAGSRNYDISGSTYLVVRDVTVLDTLIGGNAGNSTRTISGTGYTYAYGLSMYGDDYAETQLRGSDPTQANLDESSIFTGGSNNSSMAGSMVYIGGDSEIWDIQAGGRRAPSSTTDAFVEVSGSAWIKHVLCGSITDGNNGTWSNGTYSDRSSVVNAILNIKDDAKVASVFGAGYDTYYDVKHVSMMGAASNIKINISGGTVGYVYGGGYRGSVGTPDQPLNSIHISISGGKILKDVFGGGRGGPDKALYSNSFGDLQTGSTGVGEAFDDSTGVSKVYVDTITIDILGDSIGGSVYGGGESAPVLDPSGEWNFAAGPNGNESEVAAVQAEAINIRISGTSTSIDGSVYGAGKGVAVSEGEIAEGVAEYQAKTILMDSNGGIKPILWYRGSDSLTYNTNYNYDGFAKLDADSISIRFDGFRKGEDPNSTERTGSVYGGGMFGTTSVGHTLDIVIRDSTVAECIYGGGKGLDGDSQPGRIEVVGTISITVSGDTIVGDESTAFAIFGGGQNAHVDAGFVVIDLEGTGVDIIGDVHGGGYGSSSYDPTGDGSHEDCIIDGDRAIVLNGANVNGNIYGGSRLGQDSFSSDQDFNSAYIALISGRVTQAVYGGGFQGKSYLDANIFVGTAGAQYAEAYLGVQPQVRDDVNVPDLWIGSIYGGGNLSGTDEDPYTAPLLMGDVVIEIAFESGIYGESGYGSDFRDLRIDGDVFGEGNYSTLDKAHDKGSVVYVHDCRMPEDRTFYSIQRCDELYIVNSNIRFSGSPDGGQQDLTERFALCNIGLLQVDRATLHLFAETSAIDVYFSVIDGEISTREDCEDPDNRNEIVIHGGRPFTLVTDDDPETQVDEFSAGVVQGFSLLSKPDGDTYYGVFAMALSNKDDNSGFVVYDSINKRYEEASIIDIQIPGRFMEDGKTPLEIRTWFLAGHMTLGEQLIFTAHYDSETGRVVKEVSFQVPRLHSSTDTVYTYIGGYVDPTVQDGMYVVSQDDYDRYTPSGKDSRTYLYMTLKGSGGKSAVVGTHYHPEDASGGYWARSLKENPVSLGSTNILTMESDLLIPKGGNTSSVGDVGVVTIHLAESIVQMVDGEPVYIPINLVDLRISIQVKPVMTAGNPVEIFVTVMSRPNGDGRYSGRAYINLPAVSANTMTYKVVAVKGIDDTSGKKSFDSISLWSDTTHLGLSGWTVIRYADNSPLPYLDEFNTGVVGGSEVDWSSQWDDGTYFGEGGIRDTSIGFDYVGGDGGFVMVILDENLTPYIITVTVKEETPVHLELAYEDLLNNQFRYLRVTSGDGRSEATAFTFQWVDEPGVDTGLDLDFGTVLGDSNITFWWSYKNKAGHGSLEQMMAAVLDETVYIDENGTVHSEYAEGRRAFTYSDNLYGWYVDTDRMTRYDPLSELKEDMTLYAGCGVRVWFHGEGVTVSPQSVIIAPGSELSALYHNLDTTDNSDNKISIWNGSEYSGHHLHNFGTEESEKYSWATIGTDQDGNRIWEAWDFGNKVYTEMHLYIPWDPNEYHLTVDVDGAADNDVTVSVTGERDVTYHPDDAGMVVYFGDTVSVSIGGMVFSTATVNWTTTDDENGSLNPSWIQGLGTNEASFIVPDVGDSGGEIKFSLVAVAGYTLTVNYIHEPGENDLVAAGDVIVLTVQQGGETKTSNITLGVRTAKFLITGDAPLTLSVEYRNSGSTQGDVMYHQFYIDENPVGPNGVRGKTLGSYTTSSNPNGDIDIDIRMFRAVGLSVGEGMGSVSVGGERIWSYDPNAQNPYDTSSAVLFIGEVLVLTAQDGYLLPPTSHSGVSEVIGEDGDVSSDRFKVRGLADVVFGRLSNSAVTITLNVSILQPTGSGADSSYESIPGTYAFGSQIRVEGSSFNPVLEFNGGSAQFTCAVPYDRTGYSVTVSMEGFESGSTTILQTAGELTGSVDMRLIVYRIVYHDHSGNQIEAPEGSLTEWSRISGTDVPYLNVQGVAATQTVDGVQRQLWFLTEGSDSTGYTAVSEIAGTLYTGLFSGGTVHLIAVPPQNGGFGSPTGSVESVLYLKESDFGKQMSNVHILGDTEEVLTFSYEGMEVVYDGRNHTLSLPPGLAGTGSVTLDTVSGDVVYTLTLTVFPDGTGGASAPEAIPADA